MPILYNLAVNWDSSIKGFNFTFTNHPLDMRTPSSQFLRVMHAGMCMVYCG